MFQVKDTQARTWTKCLSQESLATCNKYHSFTITQNYKGPLDSETLKPGFVNHQTRLCTLTSKCCLVWYGKKCSTNYRTKKPQYIQLLTLYSILASHSLKKSYGLLLISFFQWKRMNINTDDLKSTFPKLHSTPVLSLNLPLLQASENSKTYFQLPFFQVKHPQVTQWL